ncbi:MAG: hypothetical protein K2Q03_04405 [Sphingobacteriaceae bacterium]|nr:hypothetical protein [Sphingobacteriaceae bacterium]
MMNKLNKLTKEQMKNVMGGNAPIDECPTVVANNCDKCPCTDARDWCVNGLCKSRN